MREATLGFLLDGDKILLAMKKRGFGENKFNGFGGKLEENESVEKCLIREATEEIGVTPKVFKKVATLNFYFPEKKEWDQKVYAFLCTEWEGKPSESEEMKPQWFERKNIPFDKMWGDDMHWLPMVLDGESVEGDFYFEENGNVVKHNIKSIK